MQTKNIDVMISPGCNAFRVLSDKQIGAHFKYFQIKTHVQNACESHDLNMEFHSFDNGFEKLCVTNFMQEYGFTMWIKSSVDPDQLASK